MNWLILIIGFATIAFAFILYRTTRVKVRPVFAGKPNQDYPEKIIFQINNYIQDGKLVSGSRNERLYYLADNSLQSFGLPKGKLIVASSTVRVDELKRGDLLILQEDNVFIIRICLGNDGSIQYFEALQDMKLEFYFDKAKSDNLQEGFFKTSNGEVREIAPSQFNTVVGKAIYTLTE